MTIQSNSSTAATYAQGIMDSINTVSGTSTISKDGSSISQGNSLASGHIDTEASNATTICSQIKAFIGNVHSIAAEFEAVDKSIHDDIATTGIPLPPSRATQQHQNKETTPNQFVPNQSNSLLPPYSNGNYSLAATGATK